MTSGERRDVHAMPTLPGGHKAPNCAPARFCVVFQTVVTSRERLDVDAIPALPGGHKAPNCDSHDSSARSCRPLWHAGRDGMWMRCRLSQRQQSYTRCAPTRFCVVLPAVVTSGDRRDVDAMPTLPGCHKATNGAVPARFRVVFPTVVASRERRDVDAMPTLPGAHEATNGALITIANSPRLSQSSKCRSPKRLRV